MTASAQQRLQVVYVTELTRPEGKAGPADRCDWQRCWPRRKAVVRNVWARLSLNQLLGMAGQRDVQLTWAVGALNRSNHGVSRLNKQRCSILAARVQYRLKYESPATNREHPAGLWQVPDSGRKATSSNIPRGHAAHIPRGLKYNPSYNAWFDQKMLLAWFPKFVIHTSSFGIRR